MPSHRSRAALTLVIGLLAVALLAPVAQADHVYSHRYLVYGRVIDSEGHPVPNLPVEVQFKKFDLDLGSCPQDARPGPTDEMGFFYRCHHIDASVGSAGRVIVSASGVSKEYPSDPDHRETFAKIKLTEPVGAKDAATLEAWNKSYTVRGLVWQKVIGKVTLENIGVHGKTMGDVPVEVKLEYNDGKVAHGNTTSNNRYGWYEVTFKDLDEPVRSGKVTATAGGSSVTVDVDPEFKMSQALIDYPAVLAGYIKWTGGILGSVILLTAVIVGGTMTASRISERREKAQIRETSTRKRAKKGP